jgi:hypothetical protein
MFGLFDSSWVISKSYVKLSYFVTSHESLHILQIFCLLALFCFVEPFVTY